MVEGALRLMTRVWRGRAGKAKSSSGWMISATSSPCQPFPLLDCTICSSGTSNTVSWLLSSKGVCSIPCLPSCCQTDAADTGVVLHQRSANAFLRFYHRTSSSQKNCPRDTNRRSSPAIPSVVHQMLSAAFLGLSVVNFVGGPHRSFEKRTIGSGGKASDRLFKSKRTSYLFPMREILFGSRAPCATINVAFTFSKE